MNGKTKITIAFVLLAMTATVGCRITIGKTIEGDGHRIVQQREVGVVGGVELRCQGDLDIRLGDSTSLEIETDENLQKHLEARMEGNNLVITTVDRVNLKPTKGIKIRLTVPSLERIINAGSGDITAPSLQAKTFRAEMDGSGSIRISGLITDDCGLELAGSGDLTVARLESDDLAVSISGSGDINVQQGRVRRQVASIAGSGDYKAAGLDSRDAELSIAGSGDMGVQVSGNLRVEIAGSGDIRYAGDPEVEKSIDGSGTLTRR